VYADAGTQRHDPSHLLSRRLQAPLPALAAALEAGSLSPSAAAPPADRTAGAHSAAVGASAAAAAAVQPAAAAALSRRRSPTQQGDYAALLALLDGVAAREIDSALAVLGEQLTEPHVARVLSQNLPAGVYRCCLLARRGVNKRCSRQLNLPGAWLGSVTSPLSDTGALAATPECYTGTPLLRFVDAW